MYLPSKDSPFYYSIIVLQYMHLYPTAENMNNWKRYCIVSAALGILTLLAWTDYVIHFIISIKDNIPMDTSRNVAEIIGLSHCMLVSVLFEINIKTWSVLYADISDTLKFGVPPKMEAARQRAKRFSIFFTIYCFTGTLVYSLITIFIDSATCREFNARNGVHEVCSTLMPLWPFVEELNPVMLLVLNVLQILSIIFYIESTCLTVSLTWECSELLVSKIHHLTDLFIESFSTEDSILQKRRLKFCIQYHQEILSIGSRFCASATNLYGQMSFETAVILSCIGVQTLKERSLGGLIHLAGYCVAISVVCLTGQTIQDETYNIQDAVYESKWYIGKPKLTRDIQLFILRSQKPIFMDSYLLGCFNYNLLVVIVKTSYSYLTLMYNSEE